MPFIDTLSRLHQCILADSAGPFCFLALLLPFVFDICLLILILFRFVALCFMICFIFLTYIFGCLRQFNLGSLEEPTLGGIPSCLLNNHDIAIESRPLKNMPCRLCRSVLPVLGTNATPQFMCHILTIFYLALLSLHTLLDLRLTQPWILAINGLMAFNVAG